jgi:hypothetical protein
MTALLEKAFVKASSLSTSDQDFLAQSLLDDLTSEELWDETFADSQDKLDRSKRFCEVRYHRKFWKAFAKLPKHIQLKARASYQLWKRTPFHPSLQFKQIHTVRPIFSVRIGIGWRALGLKEGDEMVWFWIGSHEEYNKLIAKL